MQRDFFLVIPTGIPLSVGKVLEEEWGGSAPLSYSITGTPFLFMAFYSFFALRADTGNASVIGPQNVLPAIRLCSSQKL